ncbi:MAG: hypothetical protein B7Z10_09200 [Rhodobacterales bacterium 32-66-7]|nr:MAG: hypothetical protein B7Z10_09200 [Rhodobacterales bacterium 32-66-7]
MQMFVLAIGSIGAVLVTGLAMGQAIRVYRRGWATRKGGGRIQRTTEPGIYWFEIGALCALSLAAATAAVLLAARLV